MSTQGILAIFNDCRAGREAEFEAWFQGEHLLERLAVPGFLFGRRHAAISGSSGYFNFYLVESPAILTSKPYLERLDNPTPMTRKVMSEIFLNMNRRCAIGRFGAAASAAPMPSPCGSMTSRTSGALTSVAETLVQDPGVAACEIWTAVDPAGQPVSMEEKLRGGDKKIKACLMVDTLRQGDAEKLGERFVEQISQAPTSAYFAYCASWDNGGI